MTEFKVGDEVTFNMADFEPWQGGKGIVRKVDGPLGWGYKVEILELPPTNNAQRVGNKVDCNAAMLKLVKPEPKFAVGDWVKSLKHWSWEVARVTAVDGGIWPIQAETTDGRVGRFNAHELELVPTPAAIPPKPKFEEGDLVKSIGFQYRNFAGKSLMVDSYHEGENTYPVKVRAVGEDYEKGHDFREDELELVKRPVNSDEPLVINATLTSTGGWLTPPKHSEWKLPDSYFAVGGLDTKLKAKVTGKLDEAVEHPAHYGGDTTYEVIKVAEAWGLDKDAYLFNVLKYIARAGKKGSAVEDLKKGGFYLTRKVKQLEAAK